jgi:hypothetical protein
MVLETQKNPSQKKGWWCAQGEGPEFKPQYHKKKGTFKKLVAFCFLRQDLTM